MFFDGFYILSIDPLIVSFWHKSSEKKENSIEYFLPQWFRPKHVLEHIPWWSAPIHRMMKFKAKQLAKSIRDSTHHLVVNALDEERSRKHLFVRGTQFSANIYVNESLYQPLDETKIYDAIYTAQLTPFKRHWLASRVEKLIVVSYGGDLHKFCPDLKHADYNQSFIPRSELAKKYNQSYAGLCLSAEEGAMLASCEYLLCGIPIVSTPSKGGRDVFFSQQNSMIVPPDPAAVAQAVQHWKQNPPDPHEIREETLKKIRSMRKEYCTYIAKLIDQAGGGKNDPETLMEKYFAPPNGMASRFIRFDELGKTTLEALSLKML